MDELKYLNTERLNDIEIPEGLEARLSMKIDQWAESEAEEKATPVVPLRTKRTRLLRNISIAATIALVAGVGITLLNGEDKAHKDTYTDPEQACQEAERVLNLLAHNLNHGMECVEKANEISSATNTTISKTLKILGNHE